MDKPCLQDETQTFRGTLLWPGDLTGVISRRGSYYLGIFIGGSLFLSIPAFLTFSNL